MTGGRTPLPAPGNLPEVLWQTIEDPVQVIDRDHRIRWSNTLSGNGRTLGPADLVGRRCHEVMFGRPKPCPDCPLAEAFATGRKTVREKMFPLSDGSMRWGEVHAYPVAGPDGKTAFVIKIGFDVTPQKREQARLQKYIEYLETSVSLTGDGPDPTAAATRDRFGLTGREIEVLRLLAQGFTNGRIARLLDLSPHTVKTHVAHVYDKLGVGDRAQAAVWAARLDLI